MEDLPKLLDDVGCTFSLHLAVEEKRTVLEFVLVVVIFLCSYSISCSSSRIDTYQRSFKKNKNRSMCCLPSQKTRPENVSENFRLQWRTAARVEVHVRLFQWHFSRPLEKKITQWFLGDSYHHREIKKKICASKLYTNYTSCLFFFWEFWGWFHRVVWMSYFSFQGAKRKK